MSKYFFVAAAVLAPVYLLSPRPSWAGAIAEPAGQARGDFASISGLTPTEQAQFADSVNLLISGLPPDPARLVPALGARINSDRPASDVAAAKSVLAALRDPEHEERLMSELAAVRGGAGARAVENIKQLMTRAAGQRAAMAQAAAAAQRSGGVAFDGGGAAADASGAQASGRKPSVRLFKNEKADVSFDEFLERLYRNEPDERTRQIAAHAFTDLTEQAPRPFAGRVQTATEILRVLSRDFGLKKSAILVGTSGSGRKSVIDHVAAGIRAGVYDLDKKILEIDLSRLARLYVQSAPDGVELPFDVFLNTTLPPLAHHGVIVIRGLERLLEADANGILNLFERSMERGGQRFIFTLEDESKLPAGHFLRKHAELIRMPELEEQPATQMLLEHKAELEAESGVKIQDAAIEELVSLSKTALNRLHPQELVDNLARAVGSRTEETQRNESQAVIADLYSQVSLAAAKHRRTKSVKDYNEVVRLAEALDAEQAKLASPQARELTAEDVRFELARQYPKKASQILGNKDYKKRLLAAIPKLRERIRGQDEAVRVVSEVLETVAMGLEDEKGTMGNFLFLGPSGVGKTEISKAIAEAYSGDEASLIRMDMSEYQDKHNAGRLIGADPGTVGYDEGSPLMNKVDESPRSVVLWDEIEKGHEDILDMGLQIMDDGRLTNNKGKTTDFHQTMQIYTANLCRKLVAEMIKDGKSGKEIKAAVIERLIEGEPVGKKIFKLKPEWLNRLDAIVIFHELDKPIVIEIGELQARILIGKPLAKSGHEFVLEKGVLEYVADHGGYDQANGARPMARAIRERIRGAIKEHLKDKSKEGELGHLKITVSLDKKKGIVVTSEPKKEEPPTKSPLPSGKLGDWTRALLDGDDQSALSAESVQASYQDEVRAPAPTPAVKQAKVPLPAAPEQAPAPAAGRDAAPPAESKRDRKAAASSPRRNGGPRRVHPEVVEDSSRPETGETDDTGDVNDRIAPNSLDELHAAFSRLR